MSFLLNTLLDEIIHILDHWGRYQYEVLVEVESMLFEIRMKQSDQHPLLCPKRFMFRRGTADGAAFSTPTTSKASKPRAKYGVVKRWRPCVGKHSFFVCFYFINLSKDSWVAQVGSTLRIERTWVKQWCLGVFMSRLYSIHLDSKDFKRKIMENHWGFSTKLGDPSRDFSLFGERQAVKNRALFVWLWEVAPVLMVSRSEKLKSLIRLWNSLKSHVKMLKFQGRLFESCIDLVSKLLDVAKAWLSFALNPLSLTLYMSAGLLALIWHAFPWDGTRYVMSRVLLPCFARLVWSFSLTRLPIVFLWPGSNSWTIGLGHCPFGSVLNLKHFRSVKTCLAIISSLDVVSCCLAKEKTEKTYRMKMHKESISRGIANQFKLLQPHRTFSKRIWKQFKSEETLRKHMKTQYLYIYLSYFILDVFIFPFRRFHFGQRFLGLWNSEALTFLVSLVASWWLRLGGKSVAKAPCFISELF